MDNMELDPRFKAKLIGTLRTLLPSLELSDGGRLGIQSAFDIDQKFSGVLRHSGEKMKATLDDYLGERPLLALLMGTLSDELNAVDPAEKTGKAKVCDLPQFADIEGLATRLVAVLEGMPREYLASVELPASLARELYRNSAAPIIGDRVAIIGSWHGDVAGFPSRKGEPPQVHPPGLLGALSLSLSSGALALSSEAAASGAIAAAEKSVARLIDKPPDNVRCYLYITLKGYIHASYPARQLDRFNTLFKAFIGLGMGIELLEDGWDSLVFGMMKLSLHEKEGDAFTPLDDLYLDEGAANLFRRVRLHYGARRRSVEDIARIVRILDAEDAAPQLILAGRWLFDSRANRDSVMGFMQLAICAEVLLGTEEGDGITGMLASRCAYLIATSAKEREGLVAEFKNIYKVRSKIVHRGLGEFKEHERKQYQRLRVICNRILQKEIDLVLVEDGPSDKMKEMAQILRGKDRA